MSYLEKRSIAPESLVSKSGIPVIDKDNLVYGLVLEDDLVNGLVLDL